MARCAETDTDKGWRHPHVLAPGVGIGPVGAHEVGLAAVAARGPGRKRQVAAADAALLPAGDGDRCGEQAVGGFQPTGPGAAKHGAGQQGQRAVVEVDGDAAATAVVTIDQAVLHLDSGERPFAAQRAAQAAVETEVQVRARAGMDDAASCGHEAAVAQGHGTQRALQPERPVEQQAAQAEPGARIAFQREIAGQHRAATRRGLEGEVSVGQVEVGCHGFRRVGVEHDERALAGDDPVDGVGWTGGGIEGGG